MSPSTLTLNDGNRLPWIAFGTGTALYNKDATQAIVLAIQNGFTHLDGAQMYHNEDTLGDGILTSGKQRSELYVTTKLARLGLSQTPKSALEESLRKLKIAYVDLYLIHTPVHHKDRLKEVWKGMEEAKLAGLTKSIGVSNFTADHLNEILSAATILPAVNQIEAHPRVWAAHARTLDVHKRHGIVTASYGGLSPLSRENDSGPLGEVIERARGRLEATHGSTVTDSQVLIKWLQQKDVLVVTTSSKAERIRSYLDTANIPELNSEEVELIEATGAKYPKRYFHGPSE